jgi:hypothetical protein
MQIRDLITYPFDMTHVTPALTSKKKTQFYVLYETKGLPRLYVCDIQCGRSV